MLALFLMFAFVLSTPTVIRSQTSPDGGLKAEIISVMEAQIVTISRESCVVCHGVGREFAVDKMHRKGRG